MVEMVIMVIMLERVFIVVMLIMVTNVIIVKWS